MSKKIDFVNENITYDRADLSRVHAIELNELVHIPRDQSSLTLPRSVRVRFDINQMIITRWPNDNHENLATLAKIAKNYNLSVDGKKEGGISVTADSSEAETLLIHAKNSSTMQDFLGDKGVQALLPSGRIVEVLEANEQQSKGPSLT